MNEIKLERKKAYKNTDPMTTVNRIRQILYKNNIFVIEVSQKIEPVTGVCSCRIILGDESVRSLNIGSNGKGMNAQYSLASAYAEFMERLQNGATLWKVLGITDYMVRSRDYSKEQMIGFAEEMFKRAYDPSENYHDIATAYIESGNYREAVVFDEVNGQGKITVPSGLFNKMTGSNGMAAGNTYKEAIIQGLSEIFERYAISRMFLEEITPPTVCEDIFNETEVIRRLKRLKIVGVNYKILDCSLGINIPVLALLIEKGGKYHIHYGADPSPITALERCLTEIFQGIYPGLYRKYGIFQFNHQPCFSDFEGGCGKKEQNILYIQQHFQYSAIEQIIDIIPVPIENHSIYVYRMKELKGNYMDTIRLIEYVLSENYNTAWDKNVWDDIECFGYLRDLADWFVSDKFCHKLGTAYAFLSALAKIDKYTYERVVRDMTGLEQLGDHHIIYIAALIGKKYAADVDSEMDFSKPSSILYTYLWQQLYSGKACCHLEQEEKFGYVREKYLESVSRNVQLVMHDYLYHSIMIKSSMKNEKRN